MLYQYFRYGRDPRIKRSIMVEYEPPENLKPAEIGTLVDEYADDRDIVATIIDLAVRGYLKIKPLGDKDVEIEILREGDDLEGYERKIFEAIKESAEDGKVLKLGEGVKYEKLHNTLESVKDEVYNLMTQRGYFQENPEAVRKKYAFLGLLMFFIAFLTALVLQNYIHIGNFGMSNLFIIFIIVPALLPIFFTLFGKTKKFYSGFYSTLYFIIIFFIFPLFMVIFLSIAKLNLFTILCFLLIFFLFLSFPLDHLVGHLGRRILFLSFSLHLVRRKSFIVLCILLFFIILFMAFMLIFSFYINGAIYALISFLHHPSIEVPLGIALAGVIIAFMGLHMPRKTEKGVEMYKRVLGFKEFIERVEEDSLKRMMEEDPTKIERIIPYAIVLGIENIWIEKIGKVINYIPDPDFHRRYRVRGTIMITTEFLSASLPSVASYGKSSDGGSGFGGGRSSGGGAGGGGGGAW
jgi:uncharacterized membrane protein